MKITALISLINTKLAGELLTKSELMPFIDNVIDEINDQLNSRFPALSELAPEVTDYDFFPDKYLRSVVAHGAAWYYYVTDEEGSQAATQYQMLYQTALFKMVRDYSEEVPPQYQVLTRNGGVEFEFEHGIGLEIKPTEGVD